LRLDTRVHLTNCEFSSGRQRFHIDTLIPLSDTSPIFIVANSKDVDLRELGGLLAPGHKMPPQTRLNARLLVLGTRRAPVINLEASGIGSQFDEAGLLETVSYNIDARYASQRVSGEISARQIGTRLGLGARFNLPTTLGDFDSPIYLDLEASPIPFFKIRDLLPPAIANLRGFFNLRAHIGGSLGRPLFNIEADAPSWTLDDLANNNTVTRVTYDGEHLQASSVTSFAKTSLAASLFGIRPRRNGGTTTLTLEATLAPETLWRRPFSLPTTSPLKITLGANRVELAKVPLQAIGLPVIFSSGLVDAVLIVGGTLARPRVNLSVRGRKLRPWPNGAPLELDAALDYANDLARLTVQTTLGGRPQLVLSGHLGLSSPFAEGQWRSGVLALDVTAPSLSLSALGRLWPRAARISGDAEATAHIRGTWADPTFDLQAVGRSVNLANTRFDYISLLAHLGDHPVCRIRAVQPGGGHLDALSEGNSLDVISHELDLGFLALASEDIDHVAGRLNADVHIGNRTHGHAIVSNLSFGLRHSRQGFDNGRAEVELLDDHLELRSASLRSTSGGHLDAHGSIDRFGSSTRFDVAARALTVNLGGVFAKMDADLTVAGPWRRGMSADLTVEGGELRLPSSADEMPLPIADVRYVDSRDVRSQNAARVVLHIAQPLHIVSRELDVRVIGDLSARLAAVPDVTGNVHVESGQVTLLGHRYQIDSGNLQFTGGTLPSVVARLSRRIPYGSLRIDIAGPRLALSTLPPLHARAQLTSLVVQGRRGIDDSRVSFVEARRRTTGFLSHALVERLRLEAMSSLYLDEARSLDLISYGLMLPAPIPGGRYLTDRIFITYSHHVGSATNRTAAANITEAHVHTYLSKSGLLDTTFGDAGVASIYLYWLKRY
jgi:hypothetical protein